MNLNAKSSSRSISIFFGNKHQQTLDEFEALSKTLRRSRTGTLHFLMTHYKWYNKHQLVSLG